MINNLSYTVQQLCQAVGISRATLYEQWKKGSGPKYFHVGKRRLVTHDSANEWLSQLEKEASHES